jgi:hypothetical protein
MRWSDVFLGRPLYWLLWLVLIAVLFGLGMGSTHVRHFVPFMAVVLLLAAGAVAVVLLTYRQGERITREPFDDVD